MNTVPDKGGEAAESMEVDGEESNKGSSEMQISSSYQEESKEDELNLSARIIEHQKRDAAMAKKFPAPKENLFVQKVQENDGFERETTLIIGGCPCDIDESHFNEVFLEQLKLRFELEFKEVKPSEDVWLRKNKDDLILE